VLETLRRAGRHRYWTLAAVATVAATIAVVGSAVASQLASGVDTYTGCVSTSGDLSKFAKGTAPAKSCTGSQVQVSFSGPLPSGCADGDVLAWRSGAWNCSTEAGAPAAFEAIRQSDVGIPATGSYSELAALSLEPGSYAVSARLGLTSQGTASDPPAFVHCALIPSNEDGTPGSPGSSGNDFATLLLAPFGDPGAWEELTMSVSQKLTQPGSVSLQCASTGSGVSAHHVVVRAIEVGSITTELVGPGPLP
jgi:hypothetical protein